MRRDRSEAATAKTRSRRAQAGRSGGRNKPGYRALDTTAHLALRGEQQEPDCTQGEMLAPADEARRDPRHVLAWNRFQ